MSRTPSGLAVIAIGQKKQKMKNVTHATWSGRGCHLKKTKTKNVMNTIWSGCGHHRQKKEQGKMSRTPSGLAFIANGPKF